MVKLKQLSILCKPEARLAQLAASTSVFSVNHVHLHEVVVQD